MQLGLFLTLGICARVTVVVLCVCVCVCVSVTILLYTLFASPKVQFHKDPYGVPNTCIGVISLKMLCSPGSVLVPFAVGKLLHF